ncbi:hypothetical protein IG631_16671 [Alternaria alternata]|nr:hypothetical protein IG631_16671 [Alternaria alternata]
MRYGLQAHQGRVTGLCNVQAAITKRAEAASEGRMRRDQGRRGARKENWLSCVREKQAQVGGRGSLSSANFSFVKVVL